MAKNLNYQFPLLIQLKKHPLKKRHLLKPQSSSDKGRGNTLPDFILYYGDLHE
jgi:hypothetical protein